MNAMRNRVQLIGNVGNEPKITTLEGGKKVANFSIATHETYRDKNGEKVENTQWHNVVVWGKLADLVESYVTKGKEIGISGKLEHRQYEDKEGNTRYVSEVLGNEILLLGSKAA